MRLRTALALGPGSARLADKRSPADRAVGVGEGVGVRRDRSWSTSGLSNLGAVGDGRVTLEEGRIDVGDARNRHWEGTVSKGQ